ncbi:sugar-binding protein [Pseudomonas guariconensis]|uniref:RHS repeat domain-containing protein n=2 Tax=Pseudomonas TaxID=286 RepID=UPI001CE45B41|nr:MULTISPECIES: RHS repeat protein [Pseudomonas]MCO7565787.1 sugar-binding protein [Pseudomonas mosselii]MCO7605244.1 sugar-binding protein [Pseudomonas guariconensis]MCO7616793.1 sugar-binding protein [Pseudomonas guariconensis]MCO7641210.1 sugar-binding protein [Pseudomonas sp. S 311-6]
MTMIVAPLGATSWPLRVSTMTTQSLVHSNAFNFMSFVQGSVDPRTGQYSLAIELPELTANQLNGPSLPLRLGFNPMNTHDSGFGTGWSLNLSQYAVASGLLSLHSGERFLVYDNGPGQPPVIPERKIESFHFENVTTGQTQRFRVAHKSGLVELLEPQAPDYTLALPVRVLAPTGHGITLAYRPHNGVPCLETVIDDCARVLLRLDYSSGAWVDLDINPDTVAFARYRLERDGDDLGRVVLPDKASWTFTYRTLGEVRCLTRLQTPLAGVEEIEYEERGHHLPGDEGRTLPWVKQHVIKPGAGQPDMLTCYCFSEENFLGYGSGIGWIDDGLDNLYRFTGADYFYSSVASHYQHGEVARTVACTFNRFHLMTEQVITEQGCVEAKTIKYGELANMRFEDQPANFQLPCLTITSWRRGNDRRDEEVNTTYDHYGNLIWQQQANGVQTHSSYLPAEQDPEGFVRHLDTQEVIPTTGEGMAEALRSVYSYIELPSLAQDGKGTLLLETEKLVRVRDDAVLQLTETQYHATVGDPLRYGRPRQQVLVLDGKRTCSDYAYALASLDGHPVVQTEQTITGFDHGAPLTLRETLHTKAGTVRHARKVNTLQHSVLIGEPMLNYDDNEVQIAYVYDVLRRVTQETVAPGTPYCATRNYSYHLSANGEPAVQTQVDVKGVTTWTYVDGLNRVVRQERQDPDYGRTSEAKEAARLFYKALFDELGNLVWEAEHDWLELVDLPLLTSYEYDGWRQRCCEVGPDRVRNHDVTDLTGAPDFTGPIRRQWRESADQSLRSGMTITQLNLFDQPVWVERVDTEQRRVSLHQYFYDGLGRRAREVDGRGAQTSFRHDEFGRLTDHTLADDSVVHRVYASHSTEDLPVSIEVVDGSDQTRYLLGTQAFDGLGRLIGSVTGGRERTQLYAPGQRQPEAVITPAGVCITYEYLPQLGEEPLRRILTTSGVEANYQYDKENARLLWCEENDESLSREYFSTGELKLERRERPGEAPFEMKYVYSLQGRLLSYTDVLEHTQSYRYNAYGQLEQTCLENIVSTFTYDGLGRMDSILTETQDPDGQPRYLKTALAYDDFDRESSRTFDLGDSVQVLKQCYDAVDAIKTKTLKSGEQLLREETYGYDPRGRLEEYDCEGEDEYVPVDSYGKKIQAQVFTFDALDNIIRVRTLFEGGRIDARYRFENEQDPAQLTGIEITGLEDVPRVIALTYDPDGNLTCDEQGRTLVYDALGRLERVQAPAQGIDALYGYDPLDRLVTQSN